MTIFVITFIQSGVLTDQEIRFSHNAATNLKQKWLNQNYNENEDFINIEMFLIGIVDGRFTL